MRARRDKHHLDCQCGQELLIIFDEEIVGEKNIEYHVCPMLLMGCGNDEHDEFWVKVKD